MFTFWAPGFDALRCAKQHNMLQNFLKTFSVLLCKQHLVDLTKLISLSVPEIRDPKLIWAIIQAKCLLMSKCIGKLCFTDFIPQRARSGTNSPAWGFTRNCCAAPRCHGGHGHEPGLLWADMSSWGAACTGMCREVPAWECDKRDLCKPSMDALLYMWSCFGWLKR